jgi:plasmid replication initiation protein
MKKMNYEIYKSNALVEASYRLSVQEQRIILACIAQIRRDQPITDDVLYSVRAVDLAELSGNNPSDAYIELKNASLRLKRREVRLTKEPNGHGKKSSVMITGWVQTIFYREGEGCVDLRFSKDMLKYLSELPQQFTRYKLHDVAKMDSIYAIRLYELLIQWVETESFREISLSDLRRWFVLEDRYTSIRDFKRWVIKTAVRQINEFSPLSVEWEQKKTGKSVTDFKFTFHLKDSISTC